MVNISREQKLNRWDTLPDNLKETLFSEQNSSALWRICEAQHLPADKISTVAVITGHIILGFIHAEDLAKEIKESLDLNPEIASSIAREIDRKIFGPIRNDLEKVYAAPAEEEILDLRSKPAEEEPKQKPITEEAKTEPFSAAEAPKMVSLEEKPAAKEAPAPKEEIQRPEAKEGIESQAPAEAEPMIIHKQSELKPLSGGKKSLGGLFSFLKKDKEERSKTIIPAKAQVELGIQPPKIQGNQQAEKPQSSKVARTEMPKVRVVHYTESPTATSPFPEMGGERRAQGPELMQAGTQSKIQPEPKTEKFPPKPATPKPAVSEIKAPENLPIKPTSPPVSTPVSAPKGGVEPLNLRQTLSKSELESKKPEKLEESEKPGKEEEEEMIDLSTFRKI